jgi:hypothetical protein
MTPFREIFWNISFTGLIYGLAAISIAIFIYAFLGRRRLWHIGKPDDRIKGGFVQRWKIFLRTALIDGLLHRKSLALAENLGRRRCGERRRPGGLARRCPLDT